jgi:NDP-sugar pyrophosphorylase family protein
MTTERTGLSLADWPMVILAGGLATRLRPITEKIPKALVEVAGEPFLTHQLRLLRAARIRRVVLSVGYLGGMIEEQFGDGRAHGIDIGYSFDGPKLLGTGGAIKKALPLLGPKFLILYGDSYLPIDYAAAVKAFVDSGKSGLMTVYKNENRLEPSNVLFESGQIRIYDKRRRLPEMKHIDYGLGALRSHALDSFPSEEPFDLSEVYRDLIERGDLAGHEVSERFYEIGSPGGLAELDAKLRGASSSVTS